MKYAIKVFIPLFILFNFNSTLFADDIKIEIVKITYLDDKTDPKKPVERELIKFNDGDYWSKPETVNIEIKVQNLKNRKARFRAYSALFYLLSERDGLKYPAINDKYQELKSISNKPVWVWNRSFGGTKYISLQPKKSTRFTIKNVNIKNYYSAKDYSISAFAIRVYAKPKKKDENFKDNVFEKIFIYPM